jgi:hypothetical protein
MTKKRRKDGREENGSEGSAAGGGRSDPSEWPRSVNEEGALSPTRAPSIATVRITKR